MHDRFTNWVNPCCCAHADTDTADFVDTAAKAVISDREVLLRSAPEDTSERPETRVDEGATYTGQWRGHQRHGEGVLVVTGPSSPSGGTYEGQWREDKLHGFGKWLQKDGSSYEGEWSQDKKNGTGVEKWPDGATYEGEYLEGVKHGTGNFTSALGTSYNGHFKHGKVCTSLQMVGSTRASGNKVTSMAKGRWSGPTALRTRAIMLTISRVGMELSSGQMAAGTLGNGQRVSNMARVFVQMRKAWRCRVSGRMESMSLRTANEQCKCQRPYSL
eukprot:TRINITY_DN19960_c0_g1_i2.p1 TRINITY_DN19960_c0_g1~~TRINITY_DN19960_c0_g1_i2.p1  ORF type:complete len:273 (-),score=27.76 TRINITY_DN19960_c0_g1_i2:113-931(-)